MLRLSVQVARPAGNTDTLAHCLQRLGGSLNFRACSGPPAAAPAIFEEALAYLDEGLGLAKDEVMRRRRCSARTAVRWPVSVQLDKAEETGAETLRLALDAHDLWGISVGNWVLAVVRREQGDLDEARTLASRAVSNAERINDTSLLLRFSTELADICHALDDAVGEAAALRRSMVAARTATETLQEGLGQALEQRRVAVQAQRLAVAAQEAAARDPLTGLANRLGLERAAAGVAGVDGGARAGAVAGAGRRGLVQGRERRRRARRR